MSPIPGSNWFNSPQNQALEAALPQAGVNVSLFYGKYIGWQDLPGLQFDKRDHMNRVVRLRPAMNNATYQILKARKNSLPPPSRRFNRTTQSRVAINLGNESILETSVALHHLHGFPYLPGSAIKGVTRHYVAENQVLPALEIARRFGHDPGAGALQQGDIIFGDAWPQILGSHLELDLINPHYNQYYRQGRWPADNSDPVPITFLTVKKGVSFEFILGLSLKGRISLGTAANSVLVEMEQLVGEALSAYGIGAKTGSGYGYFN